MITAEALHPQYLKTKEGSSPFVVLPTVEYENLLEDLQDLAIMAERKDEKVISHSELLKELKTDRYL